MKHHIEAIKLHNINEIKECIRQREPIFHHRHLINTREQIDQEMHADYWEISASGKLYTREFVLDYLEERYKNNPIDVMDLEKWEVINFDVKHLADDVYMATYILEGQIFEGKPRTTRRTTLWKGNLVQGFKILFHQGTVVR